MSNYRISLKMQLQKDQAEAQQRSQANLQQPSFTQSPAIFLPSASISSTSVPGEVLQVQTNLQYPTRFHVEAKQKNQLANYLSNSVGTSKAAVSQLLRPHGSLPDRTSPGVSSAPGISAPASPLAQLNLSTSADQVDDIIDDIVSLQSSFGDDRGQLSTTLPTIDRSALPGFAQSTAATLAVYDQSKTSSSCPGEIIPKQEFLDDDNRTNYLQDRVKKDNHNRIERRRRYNINDRIKELGTLVPRSSDPDMRWNKGSILKASVDHMRDLQSRVARAQQVERKHQEMQNVNRRLLLRIQELEMLAKSKGLEPPPMQDKQEIVESLLTTDASAVSGRSFSKEEEFEVANFPSQVLHPGLNAVFKQEKISPNQMPMQEVKGPSNQFTTVQSISPVALPAAPQDYMQQPQHHHQQDIVSIDITSPAHSFSPQPPGMEDTSAMLLRGSQELNAPNPLMAFGDNAQSFSSLLGQTQSLEFDDVMMEEEFATIKNDIFLSDSVQQQ